MPRDVLTGQPTAEVDTIAEQRLWMDTERNPATLNYTMHQALVTGLEPGKHYFYRVGSFADHISVDSNGGSVGSWSDIVAFTAFPPAHREPIWAVYGEPPSSPFCFFLFWLTREATDGCTDPHDGCRKYHQQCPLKSVARYLCYPRYADGQKIDDALHSL